MIFDESTNPTLNTPELIKSINESYTEAQQEIGVLKNKLFNAS